LEKEGMFKEFERAVCAFHNTEDRSPICQYSGMQNVCSHWRKNVVQLL